MTALVAAAVGAALAAGAAASAASARAAAGVQVAQAAAPADTAWLGVNVQTLTPELKEALAIRGDGVLVADVVPDGPAGLAGIQPGDAIIAVNRTALGSADDLAAALTTLTPGRPAALRVERDGKPFYVAVTVGTAAAAGEPAAEPPPVFAKSADKAPAAAARVGTGEAAPVEEASAAPVAIPAVAIPPVAIPPAVIEKAVEKAPMVSETAATPAPKTPPTETASEPAPEATTEPEAMLAMPTPAAPKGEGAAAGAVVETAPEPTAETPVAAVTPSEPTPTPAPAPAPEPAVSGESGAVGSADPDSDAPAGASAAEPPPEGSSEAVEGAPDTVDVVAVQLALAVLGYDPGPVTGSLVTETREAIRAYQRDKGLEEDGRVTATLRTRLEAESRKAAASVQPAAVQASPPVELNEEALKAIDE